MLFRPNLHWLLGGIWFWLGLLTWSGSGAPGNANADYLLRPWQSEDGLPHQVVNSVLQDQSGFIWLATETALVRFDGVQFKEFSSPLIGSEKSSRIRALIQEDASTLLIAPDIGGLVRLRDGIFTPHPATAQLASLPIATLFSERNGAIWIGYLSGDVVRWENGRIASFGAKEGLKGQWSSWAYDKAGELWFANSGFLARYANGALHRLAEDLGERLCIASSRAGGLWIASNERLGRLEEGKITRLIESPPWVGAARVRALFEDRSGNLWIGTSARGLFRFAEGKLDLVATSHSSINAVREDYEGNLWVATHGGGLNRLRSRIFDLYGSGQGLPDDLSYSVTEDAEEGLWVGNSNGGLVHYQDERFETFGQRTNWPPLRVFSVATDGRKNVWMGTRTGLFVWNTASSGSPRQMEAAVIKDVHVLFNSRNGDVWVGSDPNVLGRFRDGSFTRFAEPHGFTGDHVRVIAETPAGELWIGTETGELFRFNGDRFQRFTTADGLPGSAVLAICVDGEGFVWIGTSGGGLVLFSQGGFSRITAAHGLPVNAIFQILLDDRQRMWFGSPAGLFHVDREALLNFAKGKEERIHAVIFGRSDGLASVSCLGGFQPVAVKSARGQLWFATRQGLLKVDTAAENINRRPPPVLLNECLADSRLLSAKKGMRVSPGVRKLEFRFSVLSYTAPEKVQVRHRLDGFDSDWVEAGSLRQVTYPKLPAGNYRLRILACNNDGVWNEKGIDLAFAVLPPWWQSAWFRICAAVTFGVLIALSVRYWSHRRLRMKLVLLEQQQALEKERARIARDLHDDLGVSLTQIALLAEMSAAASVPPERLKKNLTQVVTGARNLVRELDGILWTVNPQNDSLDKLASYLCQFSQQFFRLTNICCRFDVGENIPAFPLSPEVRHDLFLVVKEAMNNVVKHSGAGEVWLRLHATGTMFEVVIEDNGRGLSLATLQKSDRNGIRNMRTRIEGLGGTFEVQSEPNHGTTLKIHFPLNPAATAQT
ncbi:MAG: hypothetical protein H7Y43_05720 [Akkermansiaceae bacterium]|nr:hypothetical protein [Verrucomicrobiales bacterium]